MQAFLVLLEPLLDSPVQTVLLELLALVLVHNSQILLLASEAWEAWEVWEEWVDLEESTLPSCSSSCLAKASERLPSLPIQGPTEKNTRSS